MPEGTAPRCLYCLKSDGGFTSEEHPIPESLGNSTLVLPPGIVCDRCNRGKLSELDRTLVECLPVKIRRTTLGILSKAGKVPVTAFQDGQLRHDGRFAALHGDLAARSWSEEYRSKKDPRYTIGMATLTGGRPIRGRHAEELSRSLLKVGLGCAWPEQGDKLLGAEFNDVRDVILGTSRRAGYLFIGNEVHEANTALNVQYDALADRDGNVSLRVLANFYGVVMLTDSHAPAPPEALADLGSTALFGQGSETHGRP
jgi:hypothetical protein